MLVQVALTKKAGGAAGVLLTSIPALQAECSAGAPMPQRHNRRSASRAGRIDKAASDTKARAAAQEARMLVRQRAHAAHVHSRFMHKLMGRHASSASGTSAASSSADAAAALEGMPRALGGASACENHSSGSEHSRALSVKEQVEILIGEATSEDNLALMYEGWSAWI